MGIASKETKVNCLTLSVQLLCHVLLDGLTWAQWMMTAELSCLDKNIDLNVKNSIFNRSLFNQSAFGRFNI